MRFTIALKIVFSIVLLIVFAMIMGGYAAFSTSQAAARSQDIEQIFVKARGLSSSLSESALILVRYVEHYLLLPTEEEYRSIEKEQGEAAGLMNNLVTIAGSPRARETMPGTYSEVESLNKIFDEYASLSSKVVGDLRNNQPVEKKAIADIDKFSDMAGNISEMIKPSILNGIKDGGDNLLELRFNNFSRMSDIRVNILKLRDDFTTATSTNSVGGLKSSMTIIQNIDEEMDVFRSSLKVKEIIAAADAMEDVIKDISEGVSTTLALYSVLETEAARLNKLSEDFQAINSKLGANIGSSVAKAAGTSLKNLTFTNRAIIALLIAMVLVGVGVFVWLRFSVINPLTRFVGLVGELTSGDGDLTKRIPAASRDELSDLAVNFNKFIENVQEIVVEVKRSAEEVASGNNQLASTMEELSTTFTSQTEQVAGIVTDMESIRDASKMSVTDLNSCLTIMTETSEETDKGTGKLGEVRTSITHIHDKAESLSATISRLSESSSQIGDILTVINDIADQTNLLALNAAIEAARAGDAGRGFAVVADEVRKLAERTQKATSEIESIISTLQRESELASTEMAEAGHAVNAGVSVIDETARSFESVVGGVYKVKEDTTSVVGAVTQQYDVVQAVGDKTQVIASGIEESNAAVAEVSATVTHLQEMAEKLKQLVGQFKS